MSRLLRKASIGGLYTLLGVAAVSGGEASAQEAQKSWTPTQGMVGISWGAYGTDSETMKRIGLWWIRSPRNVLGATGKFWDRYRHIEIESRWFPRERGRVSPYVMVSGTSQRYLSREGVGPGVGVGAEYYPIQPVGLAAALGWRSLFRKWREPGYPEEEADIHWFTIRLEMTLYLGK